MSNRFTIIINDDDGAISLEIQDFATGTKINLSERDFSKAEGTSIFGLSKIIIGILKPRYREIVAKPKDLTQTSTNQPPTKKE